jgi:hypothetical protein
VWNTVWRDVHLESIVILDEKWFLIQPDPERELYFWQTPYPRYQERIKVRVGNLLNKEIRGDIQRNTTKWWFDDWELIGSFKVTRFDREAGCDPDSPSSF